MGDTRFPEGRLWYEDFYFSAMLLIKEPVDRFFDQVMVMAEDPALRQNRLNLLTALRAMILEVADISRIGVEE